MVNTNQKRLADELGTIRKSWQGRVRVALAYPNFYHVGMSNLGFQAVYRHLNALEHVVCERVFVPDQGTAGDSPLVSLESGRPVLDFDCLAFSIPYENDYANVLNILAKAGLPLRAALRGESLPLVMAGGVTCFLNPEPLAPFIDCFVIGEAEPLIEEFFTTFDPKRDKETNLCRLARLSGVYVPSFYRVQYNPDGTLASFSPGRPSLLPRIKRLWVEDLSGPVTESSVITPHTTFAGTHLIEVSRGCSHGCRFCGAGFIYRRPRFRPLERLRRCLEKAAAQTSRIGLVGAAVSDLPGINRLCSKLPRPDLELGFSSLRADALSEPLLQALAQGKVKTATLAPETGSERMRRVINKGMQEEIFLEAAAALVKRGIPNLKLYFMVGLPFEEPEDISAIATLVKKIKHRFLQASRPTGHMGQITVSLNCFVPKPSTPFQWAAMDETAVLKKKIRQVKNDLRKVANVRVHADVPRWAVIQGLLSRGDRKVADILELVHQNGGNWPQSLKQTPINPAFYVHRERTRDEILPWDFIDHGLTKDFLWREYRRAARAKPTPACPMDPGTCSLCGVCRGKKSSDNKAQG